MCAAVYRSHNSPLPCFGGAPPVFRGSPASFAMPCGGHAVAGHNVRRNALPGHSHRNPPPAASAGFGSIPFGSAAVPAGGLGRASMPLGSAAVPLGGSPATPARSLAGSAKVYHTAGLSQSMRTMPTDMLSQSGRPDMLSQTVRRVPPSPDMLSQTSRRMPLSGYTPTARPSPVMTPQTPVPRAMLAQFSASAATTPMTPRPGPLPGPLPGFGQQLSASQRGSYRVQPPPASPSPIHMRPALAQPLQRKNRYDAGRSENAPPSWQDQSKVKAELAASQGGTGQSPCPRREALQERNALQPEASPKGSPARRASPEPMKQPFVPPERSPPSSRSRQPEFRNLDGGGQNTTPAGRSAGPFMDVGLNGNGDDTGPAPLLTPLAVSTPPLPTALSYTALSSLTASAVENVPLVPTELAVEASTVPLVLRQLAVEPSLVVSTPQLPAALSHTARSRLTASAVENVPLVPMELAVEPSLTVSTPQLPTVLSHTAPSRSTVSAVENVPLVPRELAVEVMGGASRIPSLSFTINHKHPLVVEEEKAFILSCLQVFSDMVEREGGFREYVMREDCEMRKELAGDIEGMTPDEVLRRSSETMVQQAVRHGCDSVTVMNGGMCCMGMKKVVKVDVKCEDFEMQQQMSICWDWDVKLEEKSCHAES